MKSLDFNQMEKLQGGKPIFGYNQNCTDCFEGSQVCTTTYTVFWIDLKSTDPMPC